ncbi:MAG: membrane lipoprotein lipid attachment site-containing protein [Clostridia bacterium]|nr:membrane lipoprotein lipid attachment site-containing protein [Clostridia bacterium]
MKKIILSFLLCAMLLLSSCNGVSNYKNAPVVGYEESFSQKLEEYVQKTIKEEWSDVQSYDITWSEDWSGKYAPSEAELYGSEKPVSCTLTIQMKGETNHFIFYFAHLNNKLSPKKIVMEESGNWYEANYDETQDFIEDIYNG